MSNLVLIWKYIKNKIEVQSLREEASIESQKVQAPVTELFS